jgi:hypothetical protein
MEPGHCRSEEKIMLQGFPGYLSGGDKLIGKPGKIFN